MSQSFVEKKIRAGIFEPEELSPKIKQLFEYAIEVRKNAQAPYSNFYVGVAVVSGEGIIYSGCNVERASWTQTTHAEQNAIDSMVAYEGPSKIKALALVAEPKDKKITLGSKSGEKQKQLSIEDIPVPCGHCLQIIWENCFDDPSVPLFGLLPNGKISQTTIGDALPMRFGPTDLGVDYSRLRGGA